MRLRIVMLLAMLGCATPAMAADIYVAATSAGLNNGSQCSNAYAYNDGTHGVNVSGNQIAGNNYHLCGTFTGTTGQQLILITGGGTSGNPFIITFQPGANLTSPVWSAFGAIQVSGANWVTIDGGVNGIVQNTANGSGLANAANSKGVYIAGSSNVVVKNLTVANICQHTSTSDHVGCNTSGTDDAAIAIVDNGSSGSNITIGGANQGNTIHDAHDGVFILLNAGDTNISVTYNTISRTNFGGQFGAGAGSSGPIIFSNNNVFCVVAADCNWSESNNVFHHNGVILTPGNGTTMTGLVFSNNYFHDINPSTGYIFDDPSGTGDTPGIQIYNNIGFTTAGQAGPANAYWQLGIGVSNGVVVNNTASGPGNQCMSGQVSPTYKNNICKDMSTGVLLNGGFSGVVSNFNDFYNLQGSGNQFVGSINYANLAAWQGAGFDANSIGTNPNLTASFIPNVGSPVIGTGTNLTSLGIAGLNVSAPATFGVGGSCGAQCIARSATLPWSMGAYEVSTATNPTVPPGTLPLSLTIIVPPPVVIPPPAITITPAIIPAATVGVAYSQQFTATNCAAVCKCSVASGSVLPTGLTLSSNCLLSGIIPISAYTVTTTAKFSIAAQ